MTTRTLEQQRSQHAWKTVQNMLKSADGEKKDFAGHAKRLPTRIMTAGLGQSLAFIAGKANYYAGDREKKKPGLTVLLDCLSEWLAVRIPTQQERDLLKRLMKEDSAFLRRVTDEVLAYLNWLNRHAEACGLKPEE